MFKKRDKNADGSLTSAEFVGKLDGDKKTKAEANFSKKDLNADGKLTLEEFSAKSGGKAKS